MKKLMIAAVGALCASVGFGEIASANIVGFNTVDLIQGLNCLSTSWVTPGSDKCNLHDVMETTKLTSYDDTGSVIGDSIEMYDAGNWTTYYYVNQPASNENWGEGYEDVWIGAGSFVAETVLVDPGQAFWLRCKAAVSDFNFAGEVGLSFSGQKVLDQGLNLIGNSLPTAFDPLDTTKVQFSNQTSYDDTGSVIGDSIEIYDAGNWTTYYYVNQPASNENWGEGYENVWIGAGSFVAEDVSAAIPVGKGFWYRAKGAGTTMNIIAQE